MVTAIGRIERRQQVSAWFALQELPKHLANILPFVLGTTLAYWQTGTVDWAVAATALVAVFFLTDGTYVSNEYFDYENDRANSTRIGGNERIGVGTTGGTRVLVRGLIERRAALIFAVTCFALSIPVGLLLRYGLGTGPLTIPLGVLGILVGWFYTVPPIRACYRGLGEVFIAIAQGVVVFGAYYVQAGFDWMPLVISMPWFITLPALKIMRQFPDYEADRETGKRGLTVIYGRERMAIAYAVLVILGMISFIPVFWHLPWPLALLAIAPAILFARTVKIMLGGEWRQPQRMETSAVNAFVAMLLIPVSLTLAFLLDTWVR